jgi:hypothetical protein
MLWVEVGLAGDLHSSHGRYVEVPAAVVFWSR